VSIFKVPVLVFAACSGSEKTALLVKLIPLLNAQGAALKEEGGMPEITGYPVSC
jgi:molybdopterin-guanine dinucleotide biosynthesis protein